MKSQKTLPHPLSPPLPTDLQTSTLLLNVFTPKKTRTDQTGGIKLEVGSNAFSAMKVAIWTQSWKLMLNKIIPKNKLMTLISPSPSLLPEYLLKGQAGAALLAQADPGYQYS